MRIRYVDAAPGAGLEVVVVGNWARDQIIPVSGSSGMKKYIRNDVWAYFEAHPAVDRIAIVCAPAGRGAKPVALYHQAGGQWLDASGKEVVGWEE